MLWKGEVPEVSSKDSLEKGSYADVRIRRTRNLLATYKEYITRMGIL